MKNFRFINLIFLIAFIVYGCEKKDESNDQLNDNQITMEIEGKNFKSASIDNFDSLSDSADWNLYPGGTLVVDRSNQFNGNSSLKLISTNSCFNLEKIEGVPVNKDKIYVIHFYYNLPITTMDELNNGLGWTCMGPFRIELSQGNDVILSEWLNEIDTWTEKYFYFQPINNVPIKINLLVGTKKGIWLDDLIVLEEY